MICKNCANIFSDDLSACPECGTPIKSSAEKTEEKENEIDALVSLALSDFEDISSQVDEAIDSVAEIISDEINSDDTEEQEPKKEKKTENKNEESSVKQKGKMKKMSKKEKGAVNFIISLMVVVFIGMGALVGISFGTDVFEKDDDAVMAVALSGFSSEETKDLEDCLSKIAYIAYDGFDREKDVIVDVMAYLRPDSPGGLYSRFYGVPSLIANEPDPNERFVNENGDYSFYALEQEKVDGILSYFGFSPNHNVNEKDFYYYNGVYYFANLEADDFGDSFVSDVSSSKRIQDGSYYVECSFFDEKNKKNSNYLDAYIILNKTKNDETGNTGWEISRISHEALFDSSGFMIKDNSGKNELSFEIRTETIEVTTTKKHKPLIRYIIEYPYFRGSTEGEKAVNRLFSDLIADYRSKAESVKNPNKIYQRFLKKGGTDAELPFVTQVVARVSYNRNGYISIVEGISEGKPRAAYNTFIKAEDGSLEMVQADMGTAAVLPIRSIEGYIFDVETGEFLSKNEIINVDYQLVHEVLYRIYNGYEYESLVKDDEESSEDEGVYEEIPDDTENIGKALYESASAMGDEGYVFCYVHPKGYTESVVIPYTLENFYNEDFSVRTVEENQE